MPIIILLVLFAILFSIWIGVRSKKSLKFDQVVKDITEPVKITVKTSMDVIKDINAAEKALQKDAKVKQVEAEKLQKESVKIGDYLAEKGVVKPTDKGKETDGSEVVK